MITQFIEGHKFAVAHNDTDTFILCELDNQEITTGQPYLEFFDTQEEAIEKFGDKIIIESTEEDEFIEEFPEEYEGAI